MTSDTPRGIQTWIHYFEEGAGILWIKAFLLTVCAAAAIVAYHFMEARNFTAPHFDLPFAHGSQHGSRSASTPGRMPAGGPAIPDAVP